MIVVLLFMLTCGAINWGYAYPMALVLIVLLRPVFIGRPVFFNFLNSCGFWLILFAGMSYVAIGERSFVGIYHYGILPTIAYMIGWCAAEERREEQVRDGILALTIGFGVYAMLNVLINLGNTRYELIDFWTRSYRAATGSGVLNTMTVSCVLYTIVFEKRKAVKLLLLMLLLFGLWYMFILGTRTQFIILLIVTVLGTAMLSYRKSGIVGMLKLTGVIAGVALGVLLILWKNVFSIRELLAGTNIVLRFSNHSSLMHSDIFRLRSFWIGLKELFVYPLGGRASQVYRHNMWLDVGRVSGMIPFSLLLAYSVVCFSRMRKIYCNKNIIDGLRYLLFFLYIGAYANFFVEPIWEGQLNFFLAMCVIDGMVNAMIRGLPYESDSGESISPASGLR